MMMKRDYKYTKTTMTIREFLLEYSSIDCQPVGQRLDTQPGYGKKAKGIINTVLCGMNLGEITLHECKNGGFIYESIDGGHRKRYIKAFYECLFTTSDGRYYRDLTSDEKEMFLNTELSFVIYTNLSVYDIGYIFRNLNETTDVNHQEMLNSYGNIPIANTIRNIVRPVAGVNNKNHKLFNYTFVSGGVQKRYEQLQFDNMRLRIDEMVSRLFYRYVDGGGLGRADEKALEEMYKAELTENEVKVLEAKVVNCLDFVSNIADSRKRLLKNIGLSQAEFSLYTRLWLYMEETYGSFKIPDIDLFYREVAKVYAEFTKPATDLADDLKAVSPFDTEKTIAQQFRNTLGEHKSKEVIETTLTWLIDRVDMKSIVVCKDPKRFFPRAWREAKLAEQGFKCAITNQPLTMENAEGGHIIAHANGGRTAYDNLAMIDADINKAMGTMSVEQYKELMAV